MNKAKLQTLGLSFHPDLETWPLHSGERAFLGSEHTHAFVDFFFFYFRSRSFCRATRVNIWTGFWSAGIRGLVLTAQSAWALFTHVRLNQRRKHFVFIWALILKEIHPNILLLFFLNGFINAFYAKSGPRRQETITEPFGRVGCV